MFYLEIFLQRLQIIKEAVILTCNLTDLISISFWIEALALQLYWNHTSAWVSVCLFKKNVFSFLAMSYYTLYQTVLYISSSTWILDFLAFLKSHHQIILENFYSVIFNRHYYVNDFHCFLNEVWICIIHIIKILLIRKLNFTRSLVITINCIVFLQNEILFLYDNLFLFLLFFLYSKLFGDHIIGNLIYLVVLLYRENLSEYDRW